MVINFNGGYIEVEDPQVSPQERIRNYFDKEAVSSSLLKASYPGAYQVDKPEYNYKAALLGNLTEMLACFPSHAVELYTTSDVDMSNHIAQLIESAVNQGVEAPEDREPGWWMAEKEKLELLGNIRKEDTLMKKIQDSLEIFGVLLDNRVPVKSEDYLLASTMAGALDVYLHEVRTLYKQLWHLDGMPEMYFQVPIYAYVGRLAGMELNQNGKGLVDVLIMSPDHSKIAIIDIKTTRRLVPEFVYDISRYRYDIQAAWYTSLMTLLTEGTSEIEFAFLAISKESPVLPKLMRLNNALLDNFMIGYNAPSGNYFPGLGEYIYNYTNPISQEDARHPQMINDIWNPSSLYNLRTEQPSTGTLFS